MTAKATIPDIGLVPDDDPITLTEACDIFRGTVSVATLRSQAAQGRLVIFKIGKRNYTTRGDVRRLLSQLETTPESKSNEDGYVYFLKNGQHIKVGFSANIDQRYKTLAAAIPTTVSLLFFCEGSRKFEKSIHRRFWNFRVRREWFRATPALLQYIEELKATCAKPWGQPR